MGYNSTEINSKKIAKPTPVKKPNPFKKDVILDPEGQWKYPGQVTKIPSGDITMEGVNYPVLGVDNLGNQQMMYPGLDYTFPGQSVTEYPQLDELRRGGKKKKKSYSDAERARIAEIRGPVTNPTWENPNIYNTGGWLDNYAGGGPTPEKAAAMLRDGVAWGHPLTDKQIEYFKEIAGDLEEEYKRGGQHKLRALSRSKTHKNIKTSLNFLMARNYDIFGLPGTRFYDPNAKFEGGGWLDKY